VVYEEGVRVGLGIYGGNVGVGYGLIFSGSGSGILDFGWWDFCW
jgi:hypothetical protein